MKQPLHLALIGASLLVLACSELPPKEPPPSPPPGTVTERVVLAELFTETG